MDLLASTLHAVVGPSPMLRDEVLASLTADWSGERSRLLEPPDLGERALAAVTPSLFGGGTLLQVRCEEQHVRRHAETLASLAGQPVDSGVVVLILPKWSKSDRLAKALIGVDAYHEAKSPYGRELVSWLTARLDAADPPARRPGAVARSLIDHCGESVDELLQAYGVAAVYAGDEEVDVEHVEAMVGGVAARPIYELTGAFLQGDARTSLRLLHADRGLDAEPVLAGLANEVRRCLACLTSDEDDTVHRLLRRSGRPRNLHYVRKRARGLGRRCLLRLLSGILQAQARCRASGVDRTQVVEELLLQAPRVIRSAR